MCMERSGVTIRSASYSKLRKQSSCSYNFESSTLLTASMKNYSVYQTQTALRKQDDSVARLIPGGIIERMLLGTTTSAERGRDAHGRSKLDSGSKGIDVGTAKTKSIHWIAIMSLTRSNPGLDPLMLFDPLQFLPHDTFFIDCDGHRSDPSMTAALLDRVTHKAHVINCSWESYRLKETLKRSPK